MAKIAKNSEKYALNVYILLQNSTKLLNSIKSVKNAKNDIFYYKKLQNCLNC